MLLMIDNYDSFTYNLVQYLGELGQEVVVRRNDEMSSSDVGIMQPSKIVLSPGPCTPSQAGISNDVVRDWGESIPILGVCLGHQCIGEVFGGTVVRAKSVMHGKTSMVHHEQQGVFAGLGSPFEATRYHSLVVDPASVPSTLEVTAWTQNIDDTLDEVMGFRHRRLPIEGVQFHPESILTQHGHDLLKNFLERYS